MDFLTIVLGNYSQIGSGKFGSVYKYNDIVAIKRILCLSLDTSDKSKRKLEDSKMEIHVLSEVLTILIL